MYLGVILLSSKKFFMSTIIDMFVIAGTLFNDICRFVDNVQCAHLIPAPVDIAASVWLYKQPWITI